MKPDYYSIVVFSARIANDPKIPWRRAEKIVKEFCGSIVINFTELKTAWEEFSHAGCSREIQRIKY